MRRWVIPVTGALLVAAAALVAQLEPSASPHLTKLGRPERAAPLCPWRNPEGDMRHFFPGATGYVTRICILSGERIELSRRLGRSPSPNEDAIYIYRIYRKTSPVGTVVAQRVKGEYGAIEIVVAFRPDGAVCGLRIQRLREPNEIARAVLSPPWLASLTGRVDQEGWSSDDAIRSIAPVARQSAREIAEGVRSLSILLDVASHAPSIQVEDHRSL